MAKPVSKIRFSLRVGGAVDDPRGPWTRFEDRIGYIEDWSGLLSEGPVSGDIIEQDWVTGALWQQGKKKTYSFEVPYTALVPEGTVEPNIWDSYVAHYRLFALRGPQLTMRREFVDKNGNTVRTDQALGVLVTDLPAEVGIGRVIHSVAIFQNLSGYWQPEVPKTSTLVETFDALDDDVWAVTSGVSMMAGQLAMSWGNGYQTSQSLVSVGSYDLVSSSVMIKVLSLGQVRYDGNVLFYPIGLWNEALTVNVSFIVKSSGSAPKMYPHTTTHGDVGAGTTWDPAAHRWLRIAESGGDIYWQTSGDLITWTTLHSVPTDSIAGWTPYRVRVGIFSNTGVGAGILVQRVCNFDDLNTTGSVVLPASQFTENFASPADDDKWGVIGSNITFPSGTCVYTWDGQLSAPQQYIFSKQVLNLKSSAVYVKIPFVASGTRPFYMTPLRLWDESLKWVVDFRLQYTSGAWQLTASVNTPNGYGGTGGTAVYSSSTHAWLRISESNGRVFWHTSTNGTTWTQFGFTDLGGSYLDGWDPTTIRIGSAVETATSTGIAGKVLTIDNINTLL